MKLLAAGRSFQLKSDTVVDSTGYQPRRETFELLRSSQDQRAARVLAIGLGHRNQSVHSQSLAGLIERCDSAAARCILIHFDKINPDEYPSLLPLAFEMEPHILEALAGDNSRLKHCAIRAIVQFQCVPAFSALVTIAEDTSHKLGRLAGQELVELAHRLGQNARHQQDRSLARSDLLHLLKNALIRQIDQPNQDILQAFLACLNWDDAILTSFLSDHDHELSRRIQDHLRNSREAGALDLLAGILWRRSAPRCALSILSQRPDRELAILMGRMASTGVNTSVQHHLSMIPCPKSLKRVVPSDPSIPLEVRNGISMLLAYSDAPANLVLHTAVVRLKEGTPLSQNVACTILHHYRKLRLDDIVRTLSQSNSTVTPSELEIPTLRETLAQLLVLYPSLPKMVQVEVMGFFGDFTCDELFQRLNDWPSNSLRVFACIVRILHPEWPEQMHRQVTSPSPKLRSRGLRAVRFLGLSDELWLDAVKLTRDYHDQVRVEAVRAVGISTKDEAIQILTELVKDVSSDVCQTAKVCLSSKVQDLRSRMT